MNSPGTGRPRVSSTWLRLPCISVVLQGSGWQGVGYPAATAGWSGWRYFLPRRRELVQPVRTGDPASLDECGSEMASADFALDGARRETQMVGGLGDVHPPGLVGRHQRPGRVRDRFVDRIDNVVCEDRAKAVAGGHLGLSCG